MASVAPRKIAQTVADLLNPALTSHYHVNIGTPFNDVGFSEFLSGTGASYYPNQGKLNLMCSEAQLPGSQLATTELLNDFPGVSERHVYRRQFDDRIDLNFYCDAEQYLPIRFFEAWMNYITNTDNGDIMNENYSYRMKFPNTYKGPLEVTKFEKNIESKKAVKPLTYKFVNCFPLAISSMPVTYDGSDLLKCNVSFAYSRYYMESSKSGFSEFLDPLAQSLFNSGGFGFNPGGVPSSVAKMAGNAIGNILTRG